MTRRGHFAVAIALAPLYAVCYSAIKVGLAYAPPLRYGGLRAMVAGISLLVLLRLLGRPVFLESKATIEWNTTFVGLLLFLGVIGTALTTGIWYWLVQREDVGLLS